MKRTKETFFRYHPDWQHRATISGCREFDGQDLQYDSRNEYFKNKQREWLDQQVRDKRQRQNFQKMQQDAYDKQAYQLNRMRGMMQDHFTQTKKEMRNYTRQENQLLAQQRKELEKYEEKTRLQFERDQRDIMLQRGKKQQFGMKIE